MTATKTKKKAAARKTKATSAPKATKKKATKKTTPTPDPVVPVELQESSNHVCFRKCGVGECEFYFDVHGLCLMRALRSSPINTETGNREPAVIIANGVVQTEAMVKELTGK